MLAKFIFGANDFRALTRALPSRSHTSMAKKCLLFGLAFGIAMTILFDSPDGTEPEAIDHVWTALSYATAYSVPMFFGSQILFAIADRIASKSQALDGKLVTYEFSDVGISYGYEYVSGAMNWPVFTSAKITPAAIVLLVSGMQGHVVPARGFNSIAEFEAAARLVEAKVLTKTK
jgi:hypothetical protein